MSEWMKPSAEAAGDLYVLHGQWAAWPSCLLSGCYAIQWICVREAPSDTQQNAHTHLLLFASRQEERWSIFWLWCFLHFNENKNTISSSHINTERRPPDRQSCQTFFPSFFFLLIPHLDSIVCYIRINHPACPSISSCWVFPGFSCRVDKFWKSVFIWKRPLQYEFWMLTVWLDHNMRFPHLLIQQDLGNGWMNTIFQSCLCTRVNLAIESLTI